MQVAKDIPSKLIRKVIEGKLHRETSSQDFMIDCISKTIKIFADPIRKKIFLECLDSPKEFDRNPKILYHLRMLEEYGLIKYISEGYAATKFGREIWDSVSRLEVIPKSYLAVKVLLSLSKPKKFLELKKELKVNEGSLFRALKFLADNTLIVKKDDSYSLSPTVDVSKLNILISNYTDLIKDASYDRSLESLTFPKEKEIEILDLFEEEKKEKSYETKKKLLREEDLIKDHIIISYSYSSRSETNEIINSILKEQSGLSNSKYVKPLYTFEKDTIKFAYNMRYVTTLQTLLSLLALHDIPILDALMVEDIRFPRKFIKKFKGPKFGREGIRKLLNVYDRPLLQAVFLPEENLDMQNVKSLGKRLFTAGVDEMCDHRIIVENIKNFRDRAETITQIIDEIKSDFGQKIYYFLIYGEDYEERLDILKETKSKGIGIGLAPLTLGFPLTYNITKKYNYPVIYGLILQVPFTRYAKRGISKEGEFLPGFGISMNVLLKFFVLLGGDEIHVDPPLYPTYEKWKIKIQCDILNYYFEELKKPFPVLIGGVTPVTIPSLIKNYGKDIILKFTTSKLNKAEKLGFSIERSINAFRQAIEIAATGEKEITEEKYKDYIDSFKFYG
jgi:ribulose 1,5-bisphosphate carboxylase large subunit-like protein